MWFFRALLLTLSFPSLLNAFAQKPPTGWLWYREEIVKKPPLLRKKQTPQPSQSHASLKAPPTYKEKIARLREEFEEALSKSILLPSLENITLTQRLQKKMLDRSEEFSKVWVLASLIDGNQEKNPSLNHLSRKLDKEAQDKRLKKNLVTLSKEFGLFLALKEGCPYCHQFAPLAQEFADSFGFELKGVLKGKGSYPTLKNVSFDNGTLSLINPQGIYPALFLVRRTTLEVIPLAWGMVSHQELLRNCEIVINALQEAS